MASKAFKGMSEVDPQDSRAPRLGCGFHVVEITSAKIFQTRKNGDAIIIELRVLASNGHAEHGAPKPAHNPNGEASLYIQITGREPQIYQREVKSLILAALGVDTRDDAGKATLAQWDSADAWTTAPKGQACLIDRCLPDDDGKSALVGRTLAVWGRPKGRWTNYFYEVWNDAREERDGLPIFDAANPPEQPDKRPAKDDDDE